MEMTARRIQMIELNYRDRIVSAGGTSVGAGTVSNPFNNTHLYMGWSATRGLLCVSPELVKYIGERLAEENQANTQRHKAEELRSAIAKAAGKPPGGR